MDFGTLKYWNCFSNDFLENESKILNSSMEKYSMKKKKQYLDSYFGTDESKRRV